MKKLLAVLAVIFGFMLSVNADYKTDYENGKALFEAKNYNEAINSYNKSIEQNKKYS